MAMTEWTPDLTGREGPRYRAIADALADDIAAGRLPARARLPTHRDLAYRLNVSIGSVTRAYAEAERRGLVCGEVGRGTYVREPDRRETPELDHFGLLSNTAEINFAQCLSILRDVDAALAETIAELRAAGRLERLLGYGPHAGLTPHRVAACDWLARQERVAASVDSVLVTVGAHNGLATALSAVVRPGETVAAECLTYHGLKSCAATFGFRLEAIETDAEGLVPAAFEAACRRGPVRALYTIPTIQNPTASILTEGRRHEIVQIARRHGVMIIEDGVFGFLAPEAPPPLQSLAPELVIYVTSLSKSLAAGLRVGFTVVPPPLFSRLEGVLRSFHFAPPTVFSEVAAMWMRDGRADAFAARQREEAAARQRLARARLDPALVRSAPSSQHLWLTLPDGWRREEFVAAAARRGVSVISAGVFAIGQTQAPQAVRVGLCQPPTRDEVVRGVTLLAELLACPDATVSVV